MSLNLKLQSSASKNQAKTIELEIKKLEANEIRELLGIVQVIVEQQIVFQIHYLCFRIAIPAPVIRRFRQRGHQLLLLLPAYSAQNRLDQLSCRSSPWFTGISEWTCFRCSGRRV
jgi:hypothetical protein